MVKRNQKVTSIQENSRTGKNMVREYYTYSSGDKYVGEYKNNKHHGQGIYTYSNGDKYVGEFKDGNQHGHGTYIKPEGRKYEGEWKDGLKNGQGTLTFGKGESEGGQVCRVNSRTVNNMDTEHTLILMLDKYVG